MIDTARRFRNRSPFRARSARRVGQWNPAYLNPFAWYDAELGQPKNVGYVQLAGVSGDYISCPDAAALDITGDTEIVVRVAMDDWTPAGETTLVAKRTTSNFSYQLTTFTSGVLRLTLSSDGTAATTMSSTAAPVVTDGQRLWIKVTWRQSDGRAQFFTAADQDTEPSSWTQLGTDVAGFAGSSIFVGTAPLELGSNRGGSSNLLAGKVYRAIVRNGIGGAIVADFDASLCYGPGYTDSLGNAWTLSIPKVYDRSGNNRAPLTFAAGSNQPLWLPWKGISAIHFDGSSPNNILHQPAFDYVTPNADVDVRFKVTPLDITSVQPIGRLGGGDNCNFEMNGTTWRCRFFDDTPTLRVVNGTLPVPLWIPGTTVWIRYEVDIDNGGTGSSVTFSYSTDGTNWTVLETASTTSTKVWRDGGAERFDLGVAASVAFRGAMHAAEFHSNGQQRGKFDAALCGLTGYTDANGTWTAARATAGRKLVVHSPAAGTTRSAILGGTDDYATLDATAVPPAGASDPFTTMAVGRQWATPTSFGRYASTKQSSGTGKGIAMRTNGTTHQVACSIGDGTANVDVFGPTALAAGVRTAMQVSCTGPSAKVDVNGSNGVATDVSSVGDRTATNGMQIGRDSGAASNYQDFEFEALLLDDSALDAAATAQMVAYHGGA